MHTILIAEDDPAVAEMLAEILEDEGYAVRRAPDGAAALVLLAEQPCDLLLTDLTMPRCDGRALREALAVAPEWQAIPVVLMTAAMNLTADDRRSFAAVLSKPFPLEQMLAVVAGCLADRDRRAA